MPTAARTGLATFLCRIVRSDKDSRKISDGDPTARDSSGKMQKLQEAHPKWVRF